MKRGFTLIELLVVIAIIAILAAILFPVFAQAKTAAKKTVAISNQKQISTSVILYLNDYDDRYPMRGGCEEGSSLNDALNDGVRRCSFSTGYAHSMTWQSWPKYVQPYIKNVQIFEHPLRQKDSEQWAENGQILNSFAINLAIFGARTFSFESVPWTGGTQTGIGDTGSAFVLMELPHSYGAPFAVQSGGGTTTETVYPMAIREYWRAIFLVNDGGCNTTEEVDSIAAPTGGVVLGMADGSARFYQVKRFLGETPTLNEYVPGASFPGPMGSNCRRSRSAYNYSGGPAVPNLDLDAPLWALGQ